MISMIFYGPWDLAGPPKNTGRSRFVYYFCSPWAAGPSPKIVSKVDDSHDLLRPLGPGGPSQKERFKSICISLLQPLGRRVLPENCGLGYRGLEGQVRARSFQSLVRGLVGSLVRALYELFWASSLLYPFSLHPPMKPL